MGYKDNVAFVENKVVNRKWWFLNPPTVFNW